MKNLTLEEYLQKYYGLKGSLYRKKPYYTGKTNIPHYWTKQGENAYEKFVNSIYDLKDMAITQGIKDCNPINYREIYKLICITDEYEYEDPANG